MITNKIKLLEALTKLRRQHHLSDDCWYSCPKTKLMPDDPYNYYMKNCNEDSGSECNCGADAYNKILDEVLDYIAREMK